MPVPHGIIAANRAMDLSHTVQVASVQTVARRLHLLPRDFFQLLVVDEAHHTTAGTWAQGDPALLTSQAARRNRNADTR
jgi:hypothetical protein